MSEIERAQGGFRGWTREVGRHGEVTSGRQDRQSSTDSIHDSDEIGKAEVAACCKVLLIWSKALMWIGDNINRESGTCG